MIRSISLCLLQLLDFNISLFVPFVSQIVCFTSKMFYFVSFTKLSPDVPILFRLRLVSIHILNIIFEGRSQSTIIPMFWRILSFHSHIVSHWYNRRFLIHSAWLVIAILRDEIPSVDVRLGNGLKILTGRLIIFIFRWHIFISERSSTKMLVLSLWCFINIFPFDLEDGVLVMWGLFIRKRHSKRILFSIII